MNSKLKSIKELEDLLLSEGVDLARWGINQAKSIEHLWDEILCGETMIHTTPLLRVIQVAVIHIRQGNKILIEIEQKMSDGRIRARNLPLSEKMKAGESYIDAVYRGLQEELQVERNEVTLFENTHKVTSKQEDSHSYPGLRARYIFHSVDAVVVGLPFTEFTTREVKGLNQQDPVNTHRWAWKSPSSPKIKISNPASHDHVARGASI